MTTKTKTNILVRCLSILLAIALLSINVLAATVSENDGSAFITKAEFDSLKNSFQSQIDPYNSGIDNKIDAAIASYLAGITISYDPKDYWTAIQNASGGSVWWQNSVATGHETLTAEVNLSVIREMYQAYAWAGCYGWWNGGSNNNLRHYVNATTASGTDIKYYDYTSWSASNHTGTIPDTAVWNGSYHPTLQSEKNNYYNAGQQTSAGVGTRWETHKNPLGKTILRNFYTSFYPILIYTVHDHIWLDNVNENSIFTEDGRSYKTAGSENAPEFTKWGSVDNGIAKKNKTDESSGCRVEGLSMLSRESDLVDYSYRMFWGNALNTDIYYSYDNAELYTDGTDVPEITIPTVEFFDLWHKPKCEDLQTNKFFGFTLKYRKYNVEWTKSNVRDFYNEAVSQSTSIETNVGQGCLIANSNNDSASTFEIKIKFKSDPNAGQVYYIMSDKQFNKDGSLATGAKKLKEDTCNVGVEQNFTLNINEKTNIFINLRSTTNGTLSTIESFSIKKK